MKEQGRNGTKCADLKAQVQALIRHQPPEGQALLAGGPPSAQDLNSVVSQGLALGEIINPLSLYSSIVHAPPESCDVRRPPKIQSDQRASTEWNVVTLPNDDASVTVDGVIPMDVVVDTGAKRVMIGAEIAELMGIGLRI